MPDIGHRITIFNRSFSPIMIFTDLYCDRSWHMRDSGQTTISIPKTHLNYTASVIALRNLVLIENDYLPAWVGFMWTPRTEGADVHNVTVLSAERLFDLRITGSSSTLSGTPGAIASSLVTLANATEATGVVSAAADIDSSGSSLSKDYHLSNIYSALTKLADDSNMFWWVTGSRDATTSLLDMDFHWSAARGITFTTALEQGLNLEVDSYTEDGDPVSSLTAYGKGQSQDWSDVPTATATDATALAAYGLVEAAYSSLESADASSVTAVAAAQVAQRAKLRREVDGAVTKSPFPAIGDTCMVWLKRFAFGVTLDMIVYNAAWDSGDSVLRVKLRET